MGENPPEPYDHRKALKNTSRMLSGRMLLQGPSGVKPDEVERDRQEWKRQTLAKYGIVENVLPPERSSAEWLERVRADLAAEEKAEVEATGNMPTRYAVWRQPSTAAADSIPAKLGALAAS